VTGPGWQRTSRARCVQAARALQVVAQAALEQVVRRSVALGGARERLRSSASNGTPRQLLHVVLLGRVAAGTSQTTRSRLRVDTARCGAICSAANSSCSCSGMPLRPRAAGAVAPRRTAACTACAGTSGVMYSVCTSALQVARGALVEQPAGTGAGDDDQGDAAAAADDGCCCCGERRQQRRGGGVVQTRRRRRPRPPLPLYGTMASDGTSDAVPPRGGGAVVARERAASADRRLSTHALAHLNDAWAQSAAIGSSRGTAAAGHGTAHTCKGLAHGAAGWGGRGRRWALRGQLEVVRLSELTSRRGTVGRWPSRSLKVRKPSTRHLSSHGALSRARASRLRLLLTYTLPRRRGARRRLALAPHSHRQHISLPHKLVRRGARGGALVAGGGRVADMEDELGSIGIPAAVWPVMLDVLKRPPNEWSGRIGELRAAPNLVAGLDCLLRLSCVQRNTNRLTTWLSGMSVEQRDGHDVLLLDGKVVLCEEVAEYAVARAAMHEYAAAPTTARGRSVRREKVISCLQDMGISAGGSKYFGRLTDGRLRAVLTRYVPTADGAEGAHGSSWVLMSGIAAASHAALQRDAALRPHLVAFELLATRAGLLPLYPSSVDINAFITPRAPAADLPHRSLVLPRESASQMLAALTTALAGEGGGREYAKEAARFRGHHGTVVVDYRCIYGGQPAAATAAAAAAPAAAAPAAAAPAAAAPAAAARRQQRWRQQRRRQQHRRQQHRRQQHRRQQRRRQPHWRPRRQQTSV